MKVPFRQDKYFDRISIFAFCEFSRFRLACMRTYYCKKMSSNTLRTSKDKPSVGISVFPLISYCPSCREANKGDDPCVTLKSPCELCASFSDQQMTKIKNRKHFVRKQKADTSRDNELELLDDEDVDRQADRP